MRRRSGFTIVEMLVALALTIFLMAILSEAFVTGLEAFRKMKAIADMDQQMRSVTTQLRRDLQTSHFEGSRRLSSYTFSTLYDGTLDAPRLGFFSYTEGSPSTSEGQDIAPFPQMPNSYRDTDDSLHFTVRLSGKRRIDYLFGRSQGPANALDAIGLEESRFDGASDGLYAFQWAEVVYFLAPAVDANGTSQRFTTKPENDPTRPALPIFNLYRRHLLLVPDSFVNSSGGYDIVSPRTVQQPGGQTYPYDFYRQTDVSAWYNTAPTPDQMEYNTPGDVQFRQRRFGCWDGASWRLRYSPLPHTNHTPPYAVPPTLAPTMTNREGGDILATNVISFDVKVWDPNAGGTNVGNFVDLNGSNPAAVDFAGAGSNTNVAPDVVYDTWSERNNGTWDYSTEPMPYARPIRALQIKLRLWDFKTRQTREVTIIQDM